MRITINITDIADNSEELELASKFLASGAQALEVAFVVGDGSTTASKVDGKNSIAFTADFRLLTDAETVERAQKIAETLKTMFGLALGVNADEAAESDKQRVLN